MNSEYLDFTKYEAFFLDLDGVLVKSSHVLPGAPEFLRFLSDFGPVAILSNNSTRSRRVFAGNLRDKGLEVTPEMVVNSAFVASQFLLSTEGKSKVFMIGEEGLAEELQDAGHEIVEPKKAEYVVVGMDRDLTYEKLSRALFALVNGAEFIATNSDGTYPTKDRLVPGAGAMVGAIRGMGYEPREVVGKPSPRAVQAGLKALDLESAENCLLVGDRLETDILAANNANMDSVLVLTGISGREEAENGDISPNWIADDLNQLM